MSVRMFSLAEMPSMSGEVLEVGVRVSVALDDVEAALRLVQREV